MPLHGRARRARKVNATYNIILARYTGFSGFARVSVSDGTRVYGTNNRTVMTNYNSIKCVLSTIVFNGGMQL